MVLCLYIPYNATPATPWGLNLKYVQSTLYNPPFMGERKSPETCHEVLEL